MKISYQLKTNRRTTSFAPKEALPFGKTASDHMFLMDYIEEEWTNPRIIPYGPLEIMPGAKVLHYAQEIFEGSKAFKREDDELYTFRFDKNAKRFNISAEMLCMPTIPTEDQIDAVHSLLDIDRLWYPEQEDASIYIRPFMFGDEDGVGVGPSSTYKYCILLRPSGPYFQGGLKPKTFMITKKFKRVAPNSSGTAKTGGNYANSLLAVKFAREKFGAVQVLFLNMDNTQIEEAGTNNHCHVKNGEIIIPEFTDTILQSITAKSILELSKMEKYGINARQETIYYDEFLADLLTKEITEAAGLGTAASILPIGAYVLDDYRKITVGDGNIGQVTKHLYDTYVGIQRGKIQAPENWLHLVERRN